MFSTKLKTALLVAFLVALAACDVARDKVWSLELRDDACDTHAGTLDEHDPLMIIRAAMKYADAMRKVADAWKAKWCECDAKYYNAMAFDLQVENMRRMLTRIMGEN